MDIRPEILALILACAAVTAVPRVLPLVLLSRIALPPWLLAWLAYVPVAVLAALLAIEVLIVDGSPALLMSSNVNSALLAIVPALAVAALTRSLIGTVLAGVAVYRMLL
jgi:branched-subunit amino acid transport protein